MKTVFIGKEGSGKTLLMGVETERLIYRNANLYKRTKVMRPIVSNIFYSDTLHALARKKGVPIQKWQHLEELDTMSECDLFIDEIGAYFDSRTYADLPLSTRLWLAQAEKLGVHIYAGAQDWAQIDVSFRRLVKRLYELKKFIGTRRPSKSLPGDAVPWALILIYKVAPAASSDSSELRTLSLLPDFFFMGKKAAGRFDTNARVLESKSPPLKKIVRRCPEDGYTRTKYV